MPKALADKLIIKRASLLCQSVNNAQKGFPTFATSLNCNKQRKRVEWSPFKRKNHFIFIQNKTFSSKQCLAPIGTIL